jgi:hypothetical protein
MQTESLQENLSLMETNRQLLAEMRIANNYSLQAVQQRDLIVTELQKLVYLLNGFTSGGTPARSYTTDPQTTAYLSLVTNALGSRISKENAEPAEVLKASIVIARDLLQELHDYNSSPVAGQNILENALKNSDNPWEEDQEDRYADLDQPQ